MRRLSLALAATAVGVLGFASSAPAAVTPGQFNLNFTSAKVVLGSLTELEVPGTDPSLVGKTIDVKANVDGTGKVTAYSNALSFPAIPLNVSGISGTVSIVQTAGSTGQFNDGDGSLSLALNLGVKLDIPAISPGKPCTIPIPFTFDTGTHAVTATKNVAGSPLAAGAISIASVAEIPLVIASSADCPEDVATLLSSLLPGLGGGGSALKVGIQLIGTLATPGGTPYPDPNPVVVDPCKSTTPPASCAPKPVPVVKAKPVASLSSTSLKVKKGVASATIACAGTPAKNDPCAGKLALTVKYKKGKKTKTVNVGSVPYSAAAGASATVKVKFSKANQKILKAAKNKLKGTLVLTVTGGPTVTKSATVKG